MPTLTQDISYPRQIASIGIILAATFVCFASGLNSLFLFDDFPNLDALAYIQGETLVSPGFWEYVLGGSAGPTGRPVSLLTFALQAGAWPDNPAAFKLINLLIHCLNSLFIYLITLRLCRLLKCAKADTWKIALFISLVWAVHPVHSTVVLYTVQRMALLSNLFILSGIALHLHIRLADFSNRPYRQLLFLTLALSITGLLSLFSKENAPSLIFFLLVLEYIFLSELPMNRMLVKWRFIFLWLPALLIFLLPVFFRSQLQADFNASFEYTLTNRLMTQSRILWQYIGTALFPSTASTSLFHDIGVSNSLLSPITTLLSIISWMLLTGIALSNPGKYKLLLFAILWFFAGHLIESSILPLELIFNHRNYLAYYGLFFAGITSLFTLVPKKLLSDVLKIALSIAYTLILVFQTSSISNLWKEPISLAEIWYTEDPENSRNAEFYAINLAARDFDGMQQAAAIYEEAFNQNPNDFRLLLNRMSLSCATSFIVKPDDEYILDALIRVDKENRDLLSPLQQLVTLTTTNACNIYSPELLTTIISNILFFNRDNFQPKTQGLYEFELARLSFYTEDNEEGIRLLELSYVSGGDSGVLFTLAMHYINNGRYEEALEIIDQAMNSLEAYNNIRSGTKLSKLTILNEMHNEVSNFINTGQ